MKSLVDEVQERMQQEQDQNEGSHLYGIDFERNPRLGIPCDALSNLFMESKEMMLFSEGKIIRKDGYGNRYLIRPMSASELNSNDRYGKETNYDVEPGSDIEDFSFDVKLKKEGTVVPPSDEICFFKNGEVAYVNHYKAQQPLASITLSDEQILMVRDQIIQTITANKIKVQEVLNLVSKVDEEERSGKAVYDKIGLVAGNEYRPEHLSFDIFYKNALFRTASFQEFYENAYVKAKELNVRLQGKLYKLGNLSNIASVSLPVYVPTEDGHDWYNGQRYYSGEFINNHWGVAWRKDGTLHMNYSINPCDDGVDGFFHLSGAYMLSKSEGIFSVSLDDGQEIIKQYNLPSYVYLLFQRPFSVEGLYEYINRPTWTETKAERKQNGQCEECGTIIDEYGVCTTCRIVKNKTRLSKKILEQGNTIPNDLFLEKVESFATLSQHYRNPWTFGTLFKRHSKILSVDYEYGEYKVLVRVPYRSNNTRDEMFKIPENKIMEFIDGIRSLG